MLEKDGLYLLSSLTIKDRKEFVEYVIKNDKENELIKMLNKGRK